MVPSTFQWFRLTPVWIAILSPPPRAQSQIENIGPLIPQLSPETPAVRSLHAIATARSTTLSPTLIRRVNLHRPFHSPAKSGIFRSLRSSWPGKIASSSLSESPAASEEQRPTHPHYGMKAPNGHEHMESTTRMRRRPLYTCGKSVLATANRTYTKAQDSPVLQGAFTKLLEKSTRMARIVFCALQYHCLVILSAADSWILSAETAVERIFPRSCYIFDKVDELVRISESFPERSDVLVTQIISWMEISASALARWESRSTSEKEIQIDTGHEERPKSPDHTKGDVASGAQSTTTETVTKYAPEEGPEKGLKEGVDKREVDRIIGGEDQTRDSDKEKDGETCKKRKDGKSKRGKKKG